MLVAAHNAPEGQKRLADFVCDGTNDEQVIAQATSQSKYRDEPLYLSAGTFHVEPPVSNGGIECYEDHGS